MIFSQCNLIIAFKLSYYSHIYIINMAHSNPFYFIGAMASPHPVVASLRLTPIRPAAVRRLGSEPHSCLGRDFNFHSETALVAGTEVSWSASYYGGSTFAGTDGFYLCEASGIVEPMRLRSKTTGKLLRLDPGPVFRERRAVISSPDGSEITHFDITRPVLIDMVRQWRRDLFYDDDDPDAASGFDYESTFVSLPLCAYLKLENDIAKLTFSFRRKSYRRLDIDYKHPIDFVFCEISRVWFELK